MAAHEVFLTVILSPVEQVSSAALIRLNMCLKRCVLPSVVKSCQKGESRVKSSLSELESQVESSYFKFWSLSRVESVAQSRVKSIRDFYRVESEMNFASILLSNRQI